MDDLHSRTRRSYALAQETPVLKDVLPAARVPGRGASLSPLRQPAGPSSSQSQPHGRRDFYSPPRRTAPSVPYGQPQTPRKPILRYSVPQPQSQYSQGPGPAHFQIRHGGIPPQRQRFPATSGLSSQLIEGKDPRDNIATVHSSRLIGRRMSPSRIPMSQVSMMSNIEEDLPETSTCDRPSPSLGISPVSTFQQQNLAASSSKSPSAVSVPQSQSVRPSPVAKVVHQRGVSPSRIPIKGLSTSTAAQPQILRSHQPDENDGSRRGRPKMTQAAVVEQSTNTSPVKRAVPRGVSPSRIPRSTSKKELREEKDDVRSKSVDYSGSRDAPSTDTSLTRNSPEELKNKKLPLSRGTSPSRIPTSIRRKKQQGAPAKSLEATSTEKESVLARQQSLSPSPPPDKAIHRSRRSEFVKPITPSPKNVNEALNKEVKDENRHSDKVPRGVSPSRIPIKRQGKDSALTRSSSPNHALTPLKVTPSSISGTYPSQEGRFSSRYYETDIDSSVPANVSKVKNEVAETPLKDFPVPIPRALSYVSSGSESSLGILDLPRQDSSASLISFKHASEPSQGSEPKPNENQATISSSSPIHQRSPVLPHPQMSLSVYNPTAPKVPETKKIRPYSPKKSTSILHCQTNAEPPKSVYSAADARLRMSKSLESLNKLKKSSELNALKMPPRTHTSISLSGLRHAQNLMEFEVPTAEAVNDYPPPYTPPSPPETSWASLENSPVNTPSKQNTQSQLQERFPGSHETSSSVKPFVVSPYDNYLKSSASADKNFGQQNARLSKSSDNLKVLLNPSQPIHNMDAMSTGRKYPSYVNFYDKSRPEIIDRKDLAQSDAEAVRTLILGEKSPLRRSGSQDRANAFRTSSGPAVPFPPSQQRGRQGETLTDNTAYPSSYDSPGLLSHNGKISSSQPHLYSDNNRRLKEEWWSRRADQHRGQNREAPELNSRLPWGASSSLEQIHRPPAQHNFTPRSYEQQKQSYLKAMQPQSLSKGGGQPRIHGMMEVRQNEPFTKQTSADQSYGTKQGLYQTRPSFFDIQKQQPMSKGLSPSFGQHQTPQQYAQPSKQYEKNFDAPVKQQPPPQSFHQSVLQQQQPGPPLSSQNRPTYKGMHPTSSPRQEQHRPPHFTQQNKTFPPFGEQIQMPSAYPEQLGQGPMPQSEHYTQQHETGPQQSDSSGHPTFPSCFNLSEADQVAIVDLQCSSNSSPNIDYRLSGKLAFIRSNSGSDIKNRDVENSDEAFSQTNGSKSGAYRQGAAGADNVAFGGRDSATLNISTPTAAAPAQDKAPCASPRQKESSQNVPLNGRAEITKRGQVHPLPRSAFSSQSASVGVVNSAYESDECNEREDAARAFSDTTDDTDRDNILLLSQLKSLENDQCQKLGITNTGFNYVRERKLSGSKVNDSLSSEPRGLSSKLVSDYSSHETLDSIHYIANQLSPGVQFVSPKKLTTNKRINGRRRTRLSSKDTDVPTSSDSEGGFAEAREVPTSVRQPKNDPLHINKHYNIDELKNHRLFQSYSDSGEMAVSDSEAASLDRGPNLAGDSNPNGANTNAAFLDEGYISPTQDYLATTGIENFEKPHRDEGSEEKLSQLHSKTSSPARFKNPTPESMEERRDLSQMRLNSLKNSKPKSQSDARVKMYNGRPLAQSQQLLLAKKSKSSKRSFRKKSNFEEAHKEQALPEITSLENGVENGSTGRKKRGPKALKSVGFRLKKTPSVSTDLESQGSYGDGLSRTSRISRTSSGPVITKTYWTRFYILAIFSLVAMVQCIVWGTWGPIMQSTHTAFPDWGDWTIPLLNGWGPLSVIVFIVPVAWLNQRYGLRVGVTLAVSLVLGGSILRCIPGNDTAFLVLANVCAVATGISGCLTLSLPAMVAATWFPPRERTTATAVAALFSQLGSALIYLEPLIVRTSNISENCEGKLDSNRLARVKREVIRLPDAVHKVPSREIRQAPSTSSWSGRPGNGFSDYQSNGLPQDRSTTQSFGVGSSSIYGRPLNMPNDSFLSTGPSFAPTEYQFNTGPSFKESSDVAEDVWKSSDFASTNPNFFLDPFAEFDPNVQMDPPVASENTTTPMYPNLSRGQPSPGYQSEAPYDSSPRNVDDPTLFDSSVYPLNSTTTTYSDMVTLPNPLDNDTALGNSADEPFLSKTRFGNRTSRRHKGYTAANLHDRIFQGTYSDGRASLSGGTKTGQSLISDEANVDDGLGDKITILEHPDPDAVHDVGYHGNFKFRSNFHGLPRMAGITSYARPLSPSDIRNDIMNLMYIHAGMAAIMFVAVVVYFPAAPAYPPCLSSAAERLDYFSGIKAMLKNPQMVLMLVTYSFSVGVPIVWVAVMNFSLCCIGINQDISKNVAIAAIVSSCGTAFFAARLTDLMYGYLKRTIIVLLTCASFCFLWFLLISAGAINLSMVQVYLSVSGGVALQYATVPLLTELAVEVAYPCPESVVGVLIIGSFNIIAALFLLLLIIPSNCYMWVNGVLVACTSLTIVPLLFVKETYRRRALDDEEHEFSDSPQGHNNMMTDIPKPLSHHPSLDFAADSTDLSYGGEDNGSLNLADLSQDVHHTEL